MTMTTTAETAALAAQAIESGAWRWQCSWGDCTKDAAHAVTFHRQNGHVHHCPEHLAVAREWCDVAMVVDLPCPLDHGHRWTDVPTPLDVA